MLLASTRLLRNGLLALGVLAVVPLATPAWAHPGPDGFADLAERLLPGVVNIASTQIIKGNSEPGAEIPGFPPGSPMEKFFRDFMERNHPGEPGVPHEESRKSQSLGSGFIIDPSGYIVTNNHVVGNADAIVVGLSDGTELPAKVIGVDELTDVALIKVEAPAALPFVSWGDSRAVEVGDWVVCAGNPFGLGGSITAGIVSARGRDIGSGPFDDFLQIDAPINPGNSGGPVFSADGKVVGVDTAIASPTGASVGIGFAIPSEIASRIVTELRDKGRVERGWLGATLQDVPDSEGHGVLGVGITAVERNGPGQRSGLKPGDIVTAVNGQPADSARSLIRAVAATPPGATVRMGLRRQGREMELNVVVGRRPNGQG